MLLSRVPSSGAEGWVDGKVWSGSPLPWARPLCPRARHCPAVTIRALCDTSALVSCWVFVFQGPRATSPRWDTPTNSPCSTGLRGACPGTASGGDGWGTAATCSVLGGLGCPRGKGSWGEESFLSWCHPDVLGWNTAPATARSVCPFWAVRNGRGRTRALRKDDF